MQNYKGPEEAWGVIWRAIGAIMTSNAFNENIRNEVTQARAAILTATQQAGDDNYDNTVTVAGALDFKDLVVGNDYKYNIQSGQFHILHGAPCRLISKARTRVKTELLQDWSQFKKGHKLTVYPGHLHKI